ncbi:MAG TPA: hypothetical protein VI685_23480 [Candidatus Angelobacter sp.]
MSGELGAIADRVTIILPWAGLLRAVATPEIEPLRHIAHLCLPDASVEIVLSYDEQRDAGQNAPLGAQPLNEEHLASLPPLYEQAGLRVVSAAALSHRQLHTYETTWAGRLAAGRERQVWRILARRQKP